MKLQFVESLRQLPGNFAQFSQHRHELGRRTELIDCQTWKPLDELRKNCPIGVFFIACQAVECQRDIPSPISREVLRGQHESIRNAIAIYFDEPQEPQLGMKRTSSRRHHLGNHGLQQAIQQVVLSRGLNPALLRKYMHTFCRPLQRFVQGDWIFHQLITVFRCLQHQLQWHRKERVEIHGKCRGNRRIKHKSTRGRQRFRIDRPIVGRQHHGEEPTAAAMSFT